MRQFVCNCGNGVFFENNQCVACHSELGWCPACASLRSLIKESNGVYRCGDQNCGLVLEKCHNYAVENVCNRCVVADGRSSVGNSSNGLYSLCDYCRFNETIPNLSVEGNREKWLTFEQGKRRLLYTLDLLGLPYGDETKVGEPKLSFVFKEDVITKRKWLWFDLKPKVVKVFTGHANGKITINLREADDLEREKARIYFDEDHRTVIGHFRHEIGHYYWDLLVKNKCESACVKVFGDHNNPSYGDALNKYYAEGAPVGWESSYISSYATMHPWEDFAETFATYLNMISVLDTAFNMGFVTELDLTHSDVKILTQQYSRLGTMFNELNRAMGLLDLVPEILAPKITEKMAFIHQLLRNASSIQK